MGLETNLRWTVLVALLSVGCWDIGKQVQQRRLWEMEDHAHDVRYTREAIVRRDLGAARQSAVWLAEPDLVPGLPQSVAPHLDAVRAEARGLMGATDLSEASNRLTQMTAHCAACHLKLAVSVPDLETDGVELLWTGLVFESDERWEAGVAATPASASWASGTWDERRRAMASWLLEGAAQSP